MTTHTAVETSQDTPGQHRDASGRLKDTPDRFTDLADTHGWGLWMFIFLADISLSITEFFNITLQVSPWEVVTTGYLDACMPMAIKGGKVQLTRQIQCKCQYGQKSCTISTLTVRNGEAVTHHFSYDRPVEKQMGSDRGSASY